MTPDRWDAWEPQEPGNEFAERTVAAALRERRSRRNPRGARWVAVGIAAAMLVSGAAWGFSSWSTGRHAAKAVIPPLSAGAKPAVPPSTRSAEPIAPAPLDTVDAGAATPLDVPAPHVHRKSSVPVAPAIGGPDAGRKVIVPHCDCAPDQVMCSCF
jgi:hypothetical protein